MSDGLMVDIQICVSSGRHSGSRVPYGESSSCWTSLWNALDLSKSFIELNLTRGKQWCLGSEMDRTDLLKWSEVEVLISTS